MNHFSEPFAKISMSKRRMRYMQIRNRGQMESHTGTVANKIINLLS